MRGDVGCMFFFCFLLWFDNLNEGPRSPLKLTRGSIWAVQGGGSEKKLRVQLVPGTVAGKGYCSSSIISPFPLVQVLA